MDIANQFAYEAHAVRCHACAVRERLATKRAKDGQDDAGLLYSVERRD